MNDAINFMNTEGLKFFGKVNASISHELKNILAIISETAGFLNDLTDLAKQGKDLKLSLIESCSDSIAEEIQRGFTTIKQMNRFAHSVDVPVKEIDLPETVDLAIKLSGFLSFANTVRFDNQNHETQSVFTCPFLLQNLIYQVLCSAYESIGPKGEIDICIGSEVNEGIPITFSSSVQLVPKDFPNQNIKKTADILGIEIKMNASFLELEIWVPCNSNKINLLADKV